MTARAVRRRTVEINYHTRQNSAYRFGHTNSGRSSERPFFIEHVFQQPVSAGIYHKKSVYDPSQAVSTNNSKDSPIPLQVVRGIANKKVTVSGGRREIGIPH